MWYVYIWLNSKQNPEYGCDIINNDTDACLDMKRKAMALKLYLLDVTFLEDPKAFEYWYERMQPARKAKIDAFKPEASKRLSLGAGILLDIAVAEHGMVSSREHGMASTREHGMVSDSDHEMIPGREHEDIFYELEFRGRGKPYLKGAENFFFNLSHSGTKVLLGVSDREIGVDIEKINTFKDTLVNRIFSDEEKALAKEMSSQSWAASDATPGATSDKASDKSSGAAYTALWTAKESVMKYSGIGLGLMPENIMLSGTGSFQNEKSDCNFFDSVKIFEIVMLPDSDKITEINGELIRGTAHQMGTALQLAQEISGSQVSCFCVASKEYDCSNLKINTYAVGDYFFSVCI